MNKSYRNTIEIARYAEQITNVTGLEFLERKGRRWKKRFPGIVGALRDIEGHAPKKEWSADQRSFF